MILMMRTTVLNNHISQLKTKNLQKFTFTYLLYEIDTFIFYFSFYLKNI